MVLSTARGRCLDAALAGPLAGAAGSMSWVHLLVLFSLELLVQDTGYFLLVTCYFLYTIKEQLTEHVVTELWELQTHRAELVLGLCTKSM